MCLPVKDRADRQHVGEPVETGRGRESPTASVSLERSEPLSARDAAPAAPRVRMIAPFARSVVVRARELVREGLRARLLRRSLARLRAAPAGTPSASELLDAARKGWGNTSYSADVRFLAAMLRLAASASGPVLECGSGLSTILLGLFARRFDVWALEHDRQWFDRVARVLTQERIGGVRLVWAPLKPYDGYDWYDLAHWKLPRDFRLVVCDGPPESTRGGRYGLLPLIRDHLAPGALVLFDDAHTDTGQAVLHRWRDELGAMFEFSPHEQRTYALVWLPDSTRQ